MKQKFWRLVLAQLFDSNRSRKGAAQLKPDAEALGPAFRLV